MHDACGQAEERQWDEIKRAHDEASFYCRCGLRTVAASSRCLDDGRIEASAHVPVKRKGRPCERPALNQFVNQNRRRYYENTCVRQKVNPVALSHSPALQ